MKLFKTLILLILCMTASLFPAFPKTVTVTGNIYDRRTAGHLPDTEIRILTPDSTVVARTTASREIYETYATSFKRIKTGGFSVEVSDSIDRYVLVASHEGFEPHTEAVDLSVLGARQYELNLKPIYLGPAGRATELDEFTVKATKVKFYNKGDTIVYNADAFILPEGSMLDALIAQLPGVEFKEGGQIYVNGKYVESLLLNGKDFFKGNKDVMLQNIGAYTVKNVEVYDKYNEMSALMGRKIDGDSQYVMDVKLKKDYMGGFMGNAEAGAGTHGRYVGRLFGMYFNDRARFSSYLNLNNLNKRARPNSGGGYSGINTDYTGVNDVANGGFDYLVEDVKKVWSVGGNIDANYVDGRLNTDRMHESFLSGGNTYQSSFSRNASHDLSLSTDHKFTWQKPLFYTKVIPSFSYKRHNRTEESVSATFDSNVQERMDVTMEVLDAIYSASSPKELRQALVNRNRVLTRQKGNSISGNISNETSFKFRNSPDALSVSFESDYKGYRDNTLQWQGIDFGSCNSLGPMSSQAQKSRLTGNPAYDFMIRGSALYYINSPRFTWSFGYGFRHEQQRRTAERMMLEARAEHEEAVVPDLETLPPDYANTSWSRQYSNIHQINGNVQYIKTFEDGLQTGVIVSANYSITGRCLDYDGYAREGEGGAFRPVVIPISKTTGAMNASVKYGLFKMNKGNLNLTYEVRTVLPSLLEMVDLPDTSDPLNVSAGNPDLKKATAQSLSLYMRLIPRKNSHITFDMDGRYISNDNTRGYRYDSETGVRTFRTYNTNGNWSLSPNAVYYLSFGPHEQLSLNTGIGYSHSRFANMIGEDAEPTKQTVLQDRYSAEASLSWQTMRFGLSGGGKVSELFSHAVNGDIHVSYINPFARFRISIPGGLTLSSTYNVYLRSGMADRNMNRTRHLLNADLRYTLNDSWGFSVKAYDILGSVNGVDYNVDARGRTETVTNELPRYFLFSVSYNFNTKKK